MANEISFQINGTKTKTTALPHERLSKLLRDTLHLEGTKVGCDAGDCGACSVLVDGKIICACLTAVSQIEGAEIETVEGLQKDGNLSRLQESFLKFGAAQCGFCTPGMLMSALALMRANKTPNRGEVEEALGGVLCRCTGYAKIIDAVLDACGNNQDLPASMAAENCEIGRAIPRLDGEPKVTGRDKFGADAWPKDALLLRLIRSPFHHAKFEFGDVENFVKTTDGILEILTAKDILGDNSHGVILGLEDQVVFAEKLAKFKGEVVAAIIGERKTIEEFDHENFPISWTELEPILLPEEGLKKDAVQLHKAHEGNVLVRGYVARGEVEENFNKSPHHIEIESKTPFIEHAYIEPEAGYAIRVLDRLELYGCTQTSFMNRYSLAKIMGFEDEEKIRIVPSSCGGGFGSKIDLSYQPYIALAAWKLNRPVGIYYSRQSSFQSTTKRHPSDIKLQLSCDENGKISSLKYFGIFNTGAYSSWGPAVASRVPIHASGPYYVPNYSATSLAVFTHCVPSGAFRGFGVPQSAVAQECAFELMAEKLGMDALEFRALNVLQNGEPTVTGQRFESGVGIGECLKTLKAPWEAAKARAKAWNENPKNTHLRYGVGLGTCWYGCGNTGMSNPSTIRMGVQRDGQVVLHQGAIDIGQGANTVIAQIAADGLGILTSELKLIGADSDLTPDAGKTSASRQTFITGNAAQLAGEALRQKILRHANVSTDARLKFNAGKILIEDNDNAVTIDLSALKSNEFDYVFMAEETFDPPTTLSDENGQGSPYALYGYGAQLMELLVDMELGTVKLQRLTTAHDVGKAINPLLVEGQIEGGSAQGIGLALMEEFLPGKTENLHDYLIPTIGDMPQFSHHLVEVPDLLGPKGAKGLGEHVLIPTAPAILNAIYNATGAMVTDLPATPDKILKAINGN